MPTLMAPYRDWVYYSTLALELHAIVFWQVWDDGTYQPLMFPVSDTVWRQLVQ